MNTLKAKFGPLPVWGWLALVTGLLLAWYLYEQHKNGGSSTAATTSASDQAPEIVVQTGDQGTATAGTSPTGLPVTGTPVPGPPVTPNPGTTQAATPAQEPGTGPLAGVSPTVLAGLSAKPGTRSEGAINQAKTGLGNQYNTKKSVNRAKARKAARVAARKKAA